MKIEKAKRLDSALQTLNAHISQLEAYSSAMRYKIANVLDGTVEDEEKELDEVSKMKWQIHIYGKKVEWDVLYIIKYS